MSSLKEDFGGMVEWTLNDSECSARHGRVTLTPVDDEYESSDIIGIALRGGEGCFERVWNFDT
jgi:hypothetical protein